MQNAEKIINQTKKWIIDVVAACNFCPFAAKEIKGNTIHYRVEFSPQTATCLQSFWEECKRLEKEPSIETSFLIFPQSFARFDVYLDFVALAENLIRKKGFEGKFQVASFHPLYQFAGVAPNDAANYTNRSIYPMLHLLREKSIEQALKKYPNAEKITSHNIDFAREKGLAYMKLLRDNCI
jgi:hypothetical protein